MHSDLSIPTVLGEEPDRELLRFIASSFRSVWALELLLAAQARAAAMATRSWIRHCGRVSWWSARRSTRSWRPDLSRSTRQARHTCRSTTRSPHCVEEVEQLYAARPDAVRRAIVSPRRRAARPRSPTRSGSGRIEMGEVFPAAVYILCFLTSAACAWLLGRAIARTRRRLSVEQHLLRVPRAATISCWCSTSSSARPGADLRLPRLLLALAAGCVAHLGLHLEVEEE